MTRQTSREAYEALVASGKLKGAQERVLASIVRYGASTSGEILAKMEIANVNAWRARFTELQARGLISETTVRPCKVTGRNAIVWDYTGRTKPLDVKKGHRVDGKAWKEIALEIVGALGGSPELRNRVERKAREQIADLL